MMIAPIDSPVWMGENLQGLIINEQLQAINGYSEWECQVYPKRSPVIGYLFPSGKHQIYHTHTFTSTLIHEQYKIISVENIHKE